MTIKLTFDTNCILRDGQDKRIYYEQIKELEELSKKEFVEITKTDVQDTEIGNFESRLSKSSEFKENLGGFVLGHSRLGHGVFASEKESKEFEDLKNNKKIIKKNDIKDIMILQTHKKYGNDYLITNNVKDFIFDKENTKIINPNNLSVYKLKNISSEEELKKYLENMKE